MTLRVLLALLVFVLNAWALWGVATLPGRRDRIRWIAIIIAVPVVGAVLWARLGKREAGA